MRIKRMEKIPVRSYYVNAEVSAKDGAPLGAVVAHGANNDMDAPLVKAVFDALAEKYTAVRFNFSYIDGRQRDPETNAEEMRACAKRLGGDVVLVGKSYGGYVATLLAGEPNVKKVIVLGYPLHAAGNPSAVYPQDHLARAKCPVVFIVGDSDPHCELNAFRRTLPQHELHVIENADHSYENDAGRSEENEARVVEIVVKEMDALV